MRICFVVRSCVRRDIALPKQDSIFRALVGSIYFTIIDANKGYHQFGLTDGSRYTAFVTEDGFYEFKRVPFGLKNAKGEMVSSEH
jgi:hypothetical protein